ncbi:MAG: FkbM family methyltransferase [Verrucomicrobiota bacterium]
MLHSINNLFWRVFLGWGAWRRRLIFQIKLHYAPELDIRVPLGQGLCCPPFNEDIGSCFSEIFLGREYDNLLEKMPMPQCWVDMGCHAGFFSLWLLWQRRRQNANGICAALLVDADRQHEAWLERLIRINGLDQQWTFQLGAIANEPGECEFVERGYMASSLKAIDGQIGTVARVKVLTAIEIARKFPGPYDLIKLDVEGAEYEFLSSYSDLTRQARYLLVEWHSWHRGGGGQRQIQTMADQQGFALVSEIQPARGVKQGQTGVILYKNLRF